MSKPRRAEAAFKFNGKNVTKVLKDYLESVTYTDVASGESDQLDLTLQNIGAQWLGKWYPALGDKVVGTLLFHNWKKDGDEQHLPLGVFTLDEVSFSGGPMTAAFKCVAVPNKSSFRVRERTKTWKKVTLEEIGTEIAGRYGLNFSYKGDEIKIKSMEQSHETDCSFLQKVCTEYGMRIKVYAGAVTVYDQSKMEQAGAVATLRRTSFVGDRWDFRDSLAGVYTGARIAYKSGKDDEETNIYIGLAGEDDRSGRTLKINETADGIKDAYRKAAAQVNSSNEDATSLSGDIFPDTKICAGVTVKVQGMGKANGKYFVDKSTITVDAGGGTTQSVEMHKCQKRLKASP